MGCVRLCATSLLVTDTAPLHVGVVKCHCHLAVRYTALSVSSVRGWEGHNLAASWTCKWDCSTCAHHPALDSPELQGTQAGHQHLGRRNSLVLCWSLQRPSAALMSMEMQMICKHNNHFLLKAPHMTILQEIPLLRGAESDLIPPFPKALLHA